MLGDYEEALSHSRQTIAIHRQLGNRHGEAAAWAVAGHALLHLGRLREAVNCHWRALTLYRELGDLQQQANNLTHIGDAHSAAGNPQAARESWQQALTILEQLNHPDALGFRAKLADEARIAADAPRSCYRDERPIPRRLPQLVTWPQ